MTPRLFYRKCRSLLRRLLGLRRRSNRRVAVYYR